MAISDQQIFDWFLANPNADDATVAATMDQFKLTPEDIARATGTDLSNVQSRYEAVAPQTGIVTIPNTGVDTTNITGGITTLVTLCDSGLTGYLNLLTYTCVSLHSLPDLNLL